MVWNYKSNTRLAFLLWQIFVQSHCTSSGDCRESDVELVLIGRWRDNRRVTSFSDWFQVLESWNLSPPRLLREGCSIRSQSASRTSRSNHLSSRSRMITSSGSIRWPVRLACAYTAESGWQSLELGRRCISTNQYQFNIGLSAVTWRSPMRLDENLPQQKG